MKKKDIILLGTVFLIALVLLGIGLIIKKAPAGDGADLYVCIYRDGKQLGIYPLAEDDTLQLGSETEGFNKLVIKEGCAYVSEADCPGQDCINMGRIDESGDEIVCLPHKLVIRIEGGQPASDVMVR